MSKQLTKIVLAILVFTSSSLTLADHHAAPQTAALEAVFCSFEKGKDMDDLLKVTAEWDKWIDSSDSKAYAAYVMQPVINTGADFPYDYFWLGVAKNHEALGQSADEWMKKRWENSGKIRCSCSLRYTYLNDESGHQTG